MGTIRSVSIVAGYPDILPSKQISSQIRVSPPQPLPSQQWSPVSKIVPNPNVMERYGNVSDTGKIPYMDELSLSKVSSGFISQPTTCSQGSIGNGLQNEQEQTIPTSHLDLLNPYPGWSAANTWALSSSVQPEMQTGSSSAQGHDTASPTEVVNPPIQLSRFYCHQCTKSYSRRGDLERHAKSHAQTPELYDCPMPRCQHTGWNGFLRKDKLVQHLRRMHAIGGRE